MVQRKLQPYFNESPQPIIVRTTHDVDPILLINFLKYLENENKVHICMKDMLIQSNFINIDTFNVEGTLWSLKNHDILFSTLIKDTRFSYSENVEEINPSYLILEEMIDFYTELNTITGNTRQSAFEELKDESEIEDVRVFLMREQGQVAALATLRPGPNKQAGIHLFGVLPNLRGKGLGRTIHSHVLYEASKVFETHVGVTEKDNLPMLAVFEANYCKKVAEQMMFTMKQEL